MSLRVAHTQDNSPNRVHVTIARYGLGKHCEGFEAIKLDVVRFLLSFLNFPAALSVAAKQSHIEVLLFWETIRNASNLFAQRLTKSERRVFAVVLKKKTATLRKVKQQKAQNGAFLKSVVGGQFQISQVRRIERLLEFPVC